MKNCVFKPVMVSLGMVLVLMVGCGKASGPPAPLAVEEIPAVMQKAFSQTKPEVKTLVEHLNAALQSKEYTDAYQGIQMLCGVPEITKEQRLVATRALLTITSLLQSAQASGDAKAAAVLEFQQRNK